MLCLCTESSLPTSFPHILCISFLAQAFQKHVDSLSVHVAVASNPCHICGLWWFPILLLRFVSQQCNYTSSSVAPLIIFCSHCLFNGMPVTVTRCSLSKLELIIYSVIIHSIHKHFFKAYVLPAWCWELRFWRWAWCSHFL